MRKLIVIIVRVLHIYVPVTKEGFSSADRDIIDVCYREELELNPRIRIEMVGIQDTFGESVTPKELTVKYAFMAQGIVLTAKRLRKASNLIANSKKVKNGGSCND